MRRSRCPACGRIACRAGAARSTGLRSSQRTHGLDLAVHQTLAHGGTVWAVRHHEDLEPGRGHRRAAALLARRRSRSCPRQTAGVELAGRELDRLRRLSRLVDRHDFRNFLVGAQTVLRELRAETSTRRSNDPTVWLYACTAPSRRLPSVTKCSAIVASRSYSSRPSSLTGLALSAICLLAPAGRDRPQHRDQGGRAREDDARARMLLQQARVLLERSPEEALARQEHDDEVGSGVELLPVRLRLQRRHVVADVAREVCETLRVAPLRRSFGRHPAAPAIGVFASTTTVRPPGRRTTRSGRRVRLRRRWPSADDEVAVRRACRRTRPCSAAASRPSGRDGRSPVAR